MHLNVIFLLFGNMFTILYTAASCDKKGCGARYYNFPTDNR